jgi:hypothetical protein
MATMGLTGNAYGVPSAEMWRSINTGRPYILIALLCVVGVFGAFTPVQALTEQRRVNRDVNIRHQILSVFGQLLKLGTRVSPHLEVRDLGLHIWRHQLALRHPVRGVLIRVATYRLGTTPVVRPFAPPWGVGVVGLCWKGNHEVGVDVAKLARSLPDRQSFTQHAARHGGDAVMNLTWAEFNEVKHRGAVFASPIRNGRNAFIGCISFDASHGFADLDSDELRQHMSLLCVVLGQAGIEST